MKSGCLLLLLLLLACATPRLAAQHYLGVKYGNEVSVVVGAKGTSAVVRRNGKLEVDRATTFVLGAGGEYLPLFVAIRHTRVETSSRSMLGSHINKEFHLNCILETAYSLTDVFMVVVAKNWADQSVLFLFEVGQLEPRDPKHFSVVVPTDLGAGNGRFQLYLFAGGRELFQSRMAPGQMEAALDRMVRERIKDVTDAPAAPFVGPQPEYPEALQRQKVDGRATLAFVINARGMVSEPAVESASLPEFGAAALAVIGQWRFVPKVEAGHPVESRARMPFEFTAPK